MIAGIAGAAVGAVEPDVLLRNGWQKAFTGVGMAVAGGMTGGFLLMLGRLWLMQEVSRLLARRLFAPAGEQEQACRCPLGTALRGSESC
jgi:hypothetical protein